MSRWVTQQPAQVPALSKPLATQTNVPRLSTTELGVAAPSTGLRRRADRAPLRLRSQTLRPVAHVITSASAPSNTRHCPTNPKAPPVCSGHIQA